MSIATMVRFASQAEAGPPAPPPTRRGPQTAGGPPGAPDEPEGAPAAGSQPAIGGTAVSQQSNATSQAQAALEMIAGYIPSEALALYIGALAAFQPSTDTSKWIVLGIGIVFVIAFTAFSALDRETRPSTDKVVIVTALAIVSFVTYAAALPASPFLAISAQATVAAGFVAVILSLFLPRVARIAKVAP
jgi:hypothetical protein